MVYYEMEEKYEMNIGKKYILFIQYIRKLRGF